MLQAQEISLNFHCKCEQFVNFAEGTFFNFNGTAGMLLTEYGSATPMSTAIFL